MENYDTIYTHLSTITWNLHDINVYYHYCYQDLALKLKLLQISSYFDTQTGDHVRDVYILYIFSPKGRYMVWHENTSKFSELTLPLPTWQRSQSLPWVKFPKPFWPLDLFVFGDVFSWCASCCCHWGLWGWQRWLMIHQRRQYKVSFISRVSIHTEHNGPNMKAKQ